MTAIPSENRAEIDRLERKQAENPEGRYFVPLANAYRKAGDVDRAIAVLRRGLTKHPEYVSAHIVLGRCLADQENYDGAGAEFSHVLTLDSQNLVALRTLGDLSAQTGDVEGARRWYEHLLAVDPMNEEARQGIELLERSGSTAVAVDEDAGDPAPEIASEATDGEATIAADPGVSSPPDVALQSEGWPDQVPSPYEHDEGGAYSGESVVTETIAELYTRQGFYDRAIEVYEELLRRRPDDPRLQERLDRVRRLEADDVEEEETPADEDAQLAPPWEEDEASEEAAAAGSEEAEAEYVPDVDPFAASFAEGFPGLVSFPLTDSDSEPEAEAVNSQLEAVPTAESTSAPTGETIRGFLQDVLSWRPRDAPIATASDVASDATSSSLPAEEFDAASVFEPAEAGPTTESEAPSPMDVEAATDEPGTAAESTIDGAPPAPEAQGAATPPVPDDELFPWELPMEDDDLGPEPEGTDEPATTEPTPTESAPSTSRFSYDQPEPPAPAGGEPHPTTPSAEPPSPTQSGGPSSSAETSPADEDDDLESFQAWLRSLKR